MADNDPKIMNTDMEDQTYRLLFDMANDGLIILSLDGHIKDLNRTAHERLGYTREELQGVHVSKLDSPDFAKKVPVRLKDMMSRGHAVFETSHVCKDGEVVPMEVSARLIELDGERCFFSVVRDIGERKRVEEALMMTQQAVDHSSDGVFWIDLQGCIFKVNDQACHSLGYSRDELVGMYVWDIDPNFVATDWPARMEALRGKQSWRHESAHRRKDGSIFPIEVMVNRVYYNDQEYTIAFTRDLSDRRRADAALRESEERLHQAVRVSNTGIFDHDHLTDTIYWSSEHRAIYGIGKGEPVTLEGLLNRLYPEDIDKFKEAVQRAHDPGGDGLFDVQHRIVRQDGQVRWVLSRAQTLFEGKGKARRPARTVGAAVDITERMRAEEKVAYLAYYDSLTGLANRRRLHDRLDQALVVSARNKSYGALLFIDLDHFKAINDTEGHEYGDLLLQAVAQRLGAVLRETDTISRPGGDEFVVILEDIGADREQAVAHAKLTSDRILQALAKRYYLQEREYTGTASIGVVLFRGHEDTIDELLKRSDMAMYQAKKAGRGLTRFFDPLMQAAFEKRIKLESDIRKAIDLGQFELHYQLRVACGGRPQGAEALLRWTHPERGMVSPGEFIPLCEETGLILPVGAWVLETACAQLRAWEAHEATRALKLSVNISAKQFRQDNFVEQVMRILDKTGIDPTRLELELTESMFLENIEQSIAKMQSLRDIGVLFALDDFGTGYSSLSYLKKLPLSQIKIDQSFVRDIAVDKNDEIIAQTIIKMGQTLGLDVIAEGVETEEQQRILEQHGCENFQGYLFGKPIPIAAFEQALGIVPERKHG
jgi:diguanylate cyclase (GGDEF)-like protein/PAS domain S-box-containing protein